MPDLWKALGDVYGESDARPVHVEPSAQLRGPEAVSVPLDDDLAAALSAALVDGSAPAHPVTPAPIVEAPKVEESVEGPPAGEAQDRLSAWLADIDARQKLREQGPPVQAIESVTEAWRRGDDDILPAKAGKKAKRKGHRAA